VCGFVGCEELVGTRVFGTELIIADQHHVGCADPL
jgi:hypothetical protein